MLSTFLVCSLPVNAAMQPKFTEEQLQRSCVVNEKNNHLRSFPHLVSCFSGELSACADVS